MSLLVIVRHGQSQYNVENRFTGTIDTPLTDLGRHEAQQAGALLRADRFQIGFTSVLQRAIDTMAIILQTIGQTDLPVERSEALNERMYGQLQGLNKLEVAERFGADQLFRWRRGYADQPPGGESLADTYNRVVPYFESTILPHLQANQPVLVVAHGNSLRALLMRLEGITPKGIEQIELATGVPRQYHFDTQSGTFSLLEK
ncbi:phosphoglycerate mutase 1 family [Fibrella aestuarina BUZ 2]|uniref:2,3-bisphosphoglycerate-dependent phosphoglycerate mutase n=1 Tax=Fibrella aestuarina BUZ 2 TaxID=1166018 RepID=I0K1Q1_9BACT|nr:2,3-diphosphoglycerate-dependent phosphoglycerate mutase [Fibrella aestuarina]CCG98054.1 phosphoglycerate mutase 1 family [Fibrella aestuarina BUZ 2]